MQYVWNCGKTWKKTRGHFKELLTSPGKSSATPFPAWRTSTAPAVSDEYTAWCRSEEHPGHWAFYPLPSERFGHRQINPGTVFTTSQWLWSLLIPDLIWLAIFLCLCLCTHISFLHLLYIFYSVWMLFIEITACLYFSMSVGQHSNFVDMIFLFMSLPFFFFPL